MKGRRLKRDERILFNRVFVGKMDTDSMEEYIEYPQIYYIQQRFKDTLIDVESIGLEMWNKLITEGRFLIEIK